jgi:hypothetical protein
VLLQVVSSRTNKTVFTTEFTAMYKSAPWIADGFGTWAPILFTYIPLLLLIGLNIATLWALRRHNINTVRVGQSSDSERVRSEQSKSWSTLLYNLTEFSFFFLIIFLFDRTRLLFD